MFIGIVVQMAALRGDVSFRYLKQFFLVYLAIVTYAVEKVYKYIFLYWFSILLKTYKSNYKKKIKRDKII